MIARTKKICGLCVAAAVLLAGAFIVMPRGAHNSDAQASPINPATSQSGQTAAPDQWKIVPADPLSPDGVSWAPLTGDGSN
jgi:hypothetical protein